MLIALGSNLGNSPAILQQAMSRLETLSHGAFIRSDVIQTAPVDCPPGSPNYCNGAVMMETLPDLDPLQWMKQLLSIEAEFGFRPRQIVNESRILDLDWIGFGDRIIYQPPELILPHPRAQLRDFVLIPLKQVAPDWRFPDSGKTPDELLRLLNSDKR